MTDVEQSQRRSRRTLVILIAMFFAPLLLAFVLYYGSDGWRPAGATNRGDLVDPPRALPQAVLRTPQGTDLQTTSLRGKWALVYIGAGQCDARCHEALTLMRQSRLALNDEMTRVQRVFLASGECCDQAYLDTEHAGLVTARVDANMPLLETFKLNGQPAEQAGRIYIVDPLGNLMMSYEPGARHKGLLEDLKKLLKLSHIG